MANVQSTKHLRRDQLLDNYEAAASTLQTLIRAKETEISHRKDLIKMLEESKSFHDNRLQEAKQEYQTAKSHIPEGVDLKSVNARSTTPPLPPPVYQSTSTTPPLPTDTTPMPAAFTVPSQTPTKSTEFDIPLPSDNYNNRSSLDRRLSEFMKTFPNLTQAGMAHPNSTDANKPTPGYYTQQPPLSTVPPSIDMLRFPPPKIPRRNP